jgi:hypothetical protein
MKAWFNEKGNWCFEFENTEQETSRLILLIAEGVNHWRENRTKYPNAFISASLFNSITGEIFVGQNYTQSYPTVSNPLEYTSKQIAENAIKTAEIGFQLKGLPHTEKGWTSQGFTEIELALIKKSLQENKFEELL